MSMSEDLRDFVAGCFRMETGLNAVRISRIGFSAYMIEAEDGNVYTFR